MPQLNPKQKQAVNHINGPMIVVAGAGTGKTHVITERIVNLINKHNVKPEEVLALTFTDKAAEEMSDRVAQKIKNSYFEVDISTFNAFGNELLLKYLHHIGLHREPKLLIGNQKIVFLKQYFDELNLQYFAPVGAPEHILSDLSSYFSTLKNQYIKADDYLNIAENMIDDASDESELMDAQMHKELAEVFSRYNQICRREGFIDLDDQIYLLIEMLESRPNILKRIKNKYKYIMVDEFQDTNVAQSRLVDLLVGEDRNIAVVGDDDQAIYSFRGATLSNILNFNDNYPESKSIPLTENYRSSQVILDCAYRLIQKNNPNRLEEKLGINKKLKAQFKGEHPVIKHHEDIEEEADWIARDIKKHMKKGDAGSTAVLLRKNKQIDILTTYFDSNDIPYQVIGRSEDLYDQPEVKTMINFLRSIADPEDDVSLYHLLVSEAYGVDPIYVGKANSRARKELVSLEEYLSGIDNENIEGALNLINSLRSKISKSTVGELCFQFIKESGYLSDLINRAKDDPAIDARIRSLNQYFKSLVEFERVSNDKSVIGYVESLPALMASGENLIDQYDLSYIEDGRTVLILTMHRSKGLEFDRVYLFDITQSSIPGRRMSSSFDIPDQLLKEENDSSRSREEHIREERRLMYVAMTRAKKELCVSFSRNKGGKRKEKPSQFIAEAFDVDLTSDVKISRDNSDNTQIKLFDVNNTSKPKISSEIMRNNKVYLTARQVEDYINCPAEFYFRHILRPPMELGASLSYGNAIHKTIERYFLRKKTEADISRKEFLEIFESNWSQEGFISKDQAKKAKETAVKNLQHFYSREEKADRTPAYIEKDFKFAVDDVVVNGRMDAVYIDSDFVEIRDFKTGSKSITSKEKADKKTKNSKQLLIYSLAWREINGKIPDLLTLDFVDRQLIGEAEMSQRRVENIKSKIIEVAESIKAGEFNHKPSLYCTHLEYDY